MASIVDMSKNILETLVLPAIGEDIRRIRRREKTELPWIRVNKKHWTVNDGDGNNWNLMTSIENDSSSIYERDILAARVILLMPDNTVFGVAFDELTKEILEVLVPEEKEAGREAYWYTFDKESYHNDKHYFYDFSVFGFSEGY